VPPREYTVVQATETFVTPPEIVPVPFVTTHDWVGDAGCVLTATEYEEPLAIGAANVKAP
jgi:hypothetical protein